jgi:hypothetical protein
VDQVAVSVKMGCRKCFKTVATLDIATRPWQMHFGLSEFHPPGEFLGRLHEDRIELVAGLTGSDPESDDGASRQKAGIGLVVDRKNPVLKFGRRHWMRSKKTDLQTDDAGQTLARHRLRD